MQGVLKAINVNKLTKCGVTFKFWVADWFAQLNNKMGGDLKKIQTVGRYMVEVGIQTCGSGRKELGRSGVLCDRLNSSVLFGRSECCSHSR